MTAMGATFDDRVAKIENAVSDQDVRIARLENLIAKDSPETTPCWTLRTKFRSFNPRSIFSKENPVPMKETCAKLWWLEACRHLSPFKFLQNGYVTNGYVTNWRR